MLLGFIGLFGYIEYRKLSSDRQISLIASTPITSVAFRLEYATLHLQYTFEGYKSAHLKNKKKSLSDFVASYEELKKYEALMSAFLLQDVEKAETYIPQIDRLSYIRSDMEVISGAIAGQKYFNKRILKLIDNRLISILNASHDLGFDIEQNHQKDMAMFLDELSKDEKDMALLSIFIIICGLALIIILVDAVYHFKNNAERAQAAEKTNSIFAAALQSTRVGVLISDIRKESKPVVFINDAFTRMTGYELSDIQHGNNDFLFGWNTDQSSIASYKRAMNLHETATIDFTLYRQDGTPFWGEVHLSPVLDENNNLAYYVSLFNDITVFRQTQEDLIQAKSIAEQASAVKTNFLAMMSHEIRTPINGILGVIKLLQDTATSDKQEHLLGIANTSSAALSGIINDILDYAKMEAGKIEVIDEAFSMHDLVEEVVNFSSTLLGEKGITIGSSVQKDIPVSFVGDVGRLRQILLNLLSNAIKFTDKGTVMVNVVSLMSHDVDGRPGYLLRFEVQDSGIGIAPDDQDKLFQEFSQIERSFTRRFGGTGLGLAICKRLITLMKGEIGVESQLGKGTKFWFMLPLRGATEEDRLCELYAPDEDDQSLELASKKHQVLLVEDNETNRLVASSYIMKSGVSVDQACNGVEAIDMASSKQYDIILMDISMPKMDGMEATRQIRSLDEYNSKVPIVALTAHVMAGDRDLCISAGMNDYLNKPIEYPALLRSLSRWMRIRFENTNTNAQNIKSSVVNAQKDVPQDDVIPETKGSNLKAKIVFDASVLQQMSDNLSPEAVDAVTQSFLDDSAKRINGFDSKEDIDQVQNTAHTLKSCSANCGLFKFSYLMSDIETACAKKDTTLVEELLVNVFHIYDEACQALESGRKDVLDS